MKSLFVLATMALTILCWGVYGPVLHRGQVGFHADSHAASSPGVQKYEMRNIGLRSFICVGLAYFAIAVVVPVVMLGMYGEKGHWTASGTFWSLMAGAAGAIGALGIILAFQFGGKAIYVMPLVFGGAPVVNAFLTIFMAKAFRQIGPLFLAGLIMVLLGAITVLLSSPGSDAAGFVAGLKQLTGLLAVLAAVCLVIAAWGAYGPLLHKGQIAMGSSRLRPLTCVGLAYFAIAVLVPGLMLYGGQPGGEWRFSGSLWSLAAGAAGAIGALGIIMCFNFGGKPIYVMPLVFGGAPVINTFVTVTQQGNLDKLQPLFYAGLILVCAGSAIVLVFAPRGHGPAHAPAGAAPVEATAP